MHKFTPISDKVIIAKDVIEEEISEFGIIMPKIGEDEIRTGTVLAIGPGRDGQCHLENGGIEVKPGDRVVFPLGTGLNFKLDGKKYLSINARNISAIIG